MEQTTWSRTRYWIGHRRGQLAGEVFASKVRPTPDTHGHLYASVTGPFLTRRAAMWGSSYGAHWATIAEAERYAKQDATTA